MCRIGGCELAAGQPGENRLIPGREHVLDDAAAVEQQVQLEIDEQQLTCMPCTNEVAVAVRRNEVLVAELARAGETEGMPQLALEQRVEVADEPGVLMRRWRIA